MVRTPGPRRLQAKRQLTDLGQDGIDLALQRLDDGSRLILLAKNEAGSNWSSGHDGRKGEQGGSREDGGEAHRES